MSSYILTFDLGTTGNKAALIDETGRIRGACQAAYGVEYPRPGWACQAAGVFPESCRAACRTLLARTGVEPGEIAALGLSGTMNGCLAVDAEGAALYPHIIHADGRSTGQAARMEAAGVDWYRLTGNRASARGTAAKALWLRDREPGVYRRTRWFLQTKDYVRGFLTGRWGATDPSDGALSGMMDIANRRWARDALAECGIDGDKLPVILPSDTIAGGLTREAARELGLVAGTPVSVGGGDGACAAAGAGMAGAGQAYCCLGSTAWISVLAGRVLDTKRRRLIHYIDLSGAHIVPTGTVQAAATAFDWARSALGIPDIEEAARLAESVAPGADGVLFAPWLQGERTPWWDERIRGAFVGLSVEHTRAHLIRAVYEGVASGLHAALSVMEQDGQRPGPIAVLGGGAQSPLWLGILADMTGRILVPHREPEAATSLGAAMAAGVATGIWPDWEAALRMTALSEPVIPDGSRAARYAQVAAAYAGLYEALSSLGPISSVPDDRAGAAEL